MVGDTNDCLEEVKQCVAKKWPIVTIAGSEMCNKIKELKGSEEDGGYGEILKYSGLYCLEANSEDLASIVHLALAVTLN